MFYNKFYLTFLLTFLTPLLHANQDGVVIDKIIATVGVGAEKIVITAGDLNKPSVDNNFEHPTLDLLINQAVLFIEAKKFKLGTYTINPSKPEIDAKLESVKKFLGVHGANDKQFSEALDEKNLTLSELKEQIFRNVAVSYLLNFSFPAKSSVPMSAIEAYYRKNPESIAEQARLMIAEIESNELLKITKESKDLFKRIDSEKVASKLTFIDLDMIEVSKLDDATRSMIKYSTPGHICIPEISAEDLQSKAILRVFKIVEKVESRLKTLEERKVEISKIIEAKEKEKLYQNFIEDLKEQVSIKIF